MDGGSCARVLDGRGRTACIFLLSLMTVGGSAPALAQGSAVQVLPQILVTSPTLLPTPAAQTGSSVTVITGAEIQRDQRRTIFEVLNAVPGLNAVQTGGPGGLTSVFIRGTNSSHVKVLIDGIDVSDPSSANRIFDFAHLPTDDIERVEVLRGPQSGLYGADAIGGVISITTKKGEGPPKAHVMAEGGSFETFNQATGVRGATDRFNYAFNVARVHTGNVRVTPERFLLPGQAAIGNYYDNTTASTKLGADVSDNLSLNFVARYTDATVRFTGTDFPPPLFAGVASAAQTEQQNHQFFTRGEAVWTLLDGRFVNRFGAAHSNLWTWNGPPDLVPTTTKGERDKYDWRGDIIMAPGQVLVLGLEHDVESINTGVLAREVGNRGAFAEIQSEVAKRFFFVANLRNDNNDQFGNHATWRTTAAFLVPGTETKLKASYGTGFKAPSLSQLYQDFPPFFFANPNLRPERARGYDAGFEQPLLGNRVRFGSTYFRNDVDDLINCNTFCTTLINVDRAVMHGVESFITWRVTHELQLRGDYSYTIARNALTQVPLQRRPKDKYSVQLVWQRDALTLSSTLIWVGSRVDVDRAGLDPRPVSPSYMTVNLAANYALSQQATLFARADNLFDARYEDPLGYLRPGLGVFAGLRLTN